ncbi:hypothetical protein [Candidatus Cardinium sp. cBcalN2]|uniref:hypothetical protein n=1 Tax=Candidatus Cardinium sp. cBcalN2 TaxID=2699436 RepID=UPI001FB1B01B|nr:hypothetical protein [Candidatus Cardinium sp. cBcalN2]
MKGTKTSSRYVNGGKIDAVGDLLSDGKFHKLITSKGKRVQFKGNGSTNAAFTELRNKLNIPADKVKVHQNGAQVFRGGNRTFTLRTDTKNTVTISIKTDNNPQQIIIRYMCSS